MKNPQISNTHKHKQKTNKIQRTTKHTQRSKNPKSKFYTTKIKIENSQNPHLMHRDQKSNKKKDVNKSQNSQTSVNPQKAKIKYQKLREVHIFQKFKKQKHKFTTSHKYQKLKS